MVFLPTATAYICVAVGYLRTGFAFYLTFMITSYLVGFFKRLAEWPLIAKITLACGPPVLGLGYFYSTQDTLTGQGGMFLPAFIYFALSLVAGYALKRLD